MLINPTSDRATGLHVHLCICPLVTYTWKSHRHHKFNTSTNGTNHFLPETFFPRVPYAITWHCHTVAQAANLGIASEPPSLSLSRSDQSVIHGVRLISSPLDVHLGSIHLAPTSPPLARPPTSQSCFRKHHTVSEKLRNCLLF